MDKQIEKIAIIGSGISGLSASFLLKDHFDITLYEKNGYYGGHARTVFTKARLPIDTGFIVFNYQTYPHLTALFELLGVPVKKSSMSFGVSIDNGAIEYGSERLSSLFAQKRQLFNPKFLMMLRDIVKFNNAAKKFLANDHLNHDLTLAEFLQSIHVGEYFRHYYLLPMGASIWSTPSSQMHDFPAITFLRFFNNHGLLNINAPVQWYTIDGGSKVYTDKIIDRLNNANVAFRPGVDYVKRSKEQVVITDKHGSTQTFDKVIFATHSDEVLKLLESPTTQEYEYLGAINYQDNHMVLHSDQTLMPKRKKAWSSWVYLSDSDQSISLSYWMNNLQSLASENDYFVTINPAIFPQADTIVDQHIFRHPVFDHAAIIAQQKLMTIQGQNNTYYCGAYLRYGFHEDGIFSAVEVARMLGVNAPWHR